MRSSLLKVLNSPKYSLFEVLSLTLITLLLFFLNKDLFRLRIFAYILGLVYVLAVSKITHINGKKLGLLKNNFLPSIKWLLLPTLFFVFLIICIRILFPSVVSFDVISWAVDLGGYGRMLVYALISAPLQEIIFRGYLISRLENTFTNKVAIIAISSGIFSIVHIPFGSIFMVLGTFVLGLMLAHNFIKYRNLASCIFSHAIIGGTLVYFLIS